jgi:hypothetical protein
MPESHLHRQAQALRLQPDEEFHGHRVPTLGHGVIEAPIEDDTVPFPEEDATMMVFERSSPSEEHCTLDPSKAAPSLYGYGLA